MLEFDRDLSNTLVGSRVMGENKLVIPGFSHFTFHALGITFHAIISFDLISTVSILREV